MRLHRGQIGHVCAWWRARTSTSTATRCGACREAERVSCTDTMQQDAARTVLPQSVKMQRPCLRRCGRCWLKERRKQQRLTRMSAHDGASCGSRARCAQREHRAECDRLLERTCAFCDRATTQIEAPRAECLRWTGVDPVMDSEDAAEGMPQPSTAQLERAERLKLAMIGLTPRSVL